MLIDRERVLHLVRLLKGSSAGELSVTEGEVRIRVARKVQPSPAPGAGSQAGEAAGPGQPAGEAPALPADQTVVSARVVGLFYRGREPSGKPLVDVGDTVSEGQPLAVIEVLRKPTDVLSPVDGEVLKVVAEEGSGVQYGDPLFIIGRADTA